MNFILFDDLAIRNNFLPLSYTRAIADMRCGILTLKERWDFILKTNCAVSTQDYLQNKYGQITANENSIFINACFIATINICEKIKQLKPNTALYFEECLIAAYTNNESEIFEIETKIQIHEECKSVKNLWDIFSLNDYAIRLDYDLITAGRTSQKPNATNTLIGNNIFIEEGAKLNAAILNSETGPIYIGKNAEIMEASVIRGPFALCENAQTKMSTKIYGATTIGPGCKVGGEVNNSVFFANSNKAHDGFIGNAVIGEWCNLGADTNNSNLKNNYEEVKLWSEHKNTFEKTGLQFCGLIMADHAKCGINTMFNTGTVVGVSANVFGAGFPRNFIPSFSWGGASGITTYTLDKAIATAKKVFERRKIDFDDVEKSIFAKVFELTEHQRK